jgi:DNA-binding GntR family transcriptional regulator
MKTDCGCKRIVDLSGAVHRWYVFQKHGSELHETMAELAHNAFVCYTVAVFFILLKQY